MATREEIEEILRSIRLRRELWVLSPRRKNLQTLSALGMDGETVFGIIYDTLSWRDYSKGPEPDNHVPPIPGNIWVFGLIISGQQCYLKFQDKPERTVMWISIHQAERQVELPYK